MAVSTIENMSVRSVLGFGVSLVLSFTVCWPTHASRTLRISPYSVRYIYTYDTCAGRSGAFMSYQLMLTNLANINQTITVSVLPGSTAYLGSSSCGVWPIVKYAHCLLDGSGASQSGVVTALNPVTFTLGANATTTYVMGGIGEANITQAGCGGGQQPHGDFKLNVAFQISVAEDRGAIQGSMVPQIDAVVPNSQFCNIPFGGGWVCSPLLQMMRTSVPLLLNGGRPF